MIEHLDAIVGARRHLTMIASEVPQGVKRVLEGIERAGNPWRLPQGERTAWAEGLDVPVMAAKAFDKYAQSVLVAEGKPIYAVVTKFSFESTVKYDSPRFEMVDACDGGQAGNAYSRREEARRMLLTPPNFIPAEEKPKGKAAALAAPKKRAK